MELESNDVDMEEEKMEKKEALFMREPGGLACCLLRHC